MDMNYIKALYSHFMNEKEQYIKMEIPKNNENKTVLVNKEVPVDISRTKCK